MVIQPYQLMNLCENNAYVFQWLRYSAIITIASGTSCFSQVHAHAGPCLWPLGISIHCLLRNFLQFVTYRQLTYFADKWINGLPGQPLTS